MNTNTTRWLEVRITVWGFWVWWKKLIAERKIMSAVELFKEYRRLQESQKRNHALRKHFPGDVRFHVLTQRWFAQGPHVAACASGVVLLALVAGLVIAANI